MDQEGQRESAVIGAEALTVATLLLEDSNKGRRPQVSCLQADIQLEDGILTFTTKGQSFSFINEIPFHAKVKKCMRSDRLYNGDLLRLGGGIDGKPPPGGNFSEFIYRMEAPALGERPPPLHLDTGRRQGSCTIKTRGSIGRGRRQGGCNTKSRAANTIL